MTEMSMVKKSVITAVCISFCVVLPQAFHAIPGAGDTLCPIHIPVLMCGFICGWPFGIFCGLMGPLLSSLFTGMPTLVSLPPMMVECAVYGCITGLGMQFFHSGKIYPDLYVSLLMAMLTGRIAAGIVKAALFTQGDASIALWVTTYFVSTLPGMVIHLLLIPTLIFALMKARLIPHRYPKEMSMEGWS